MWTRNKFGHAMSNICTRINLARPRKIYLVKIYNGDS